MEGFFILLVLGILFGGLILGVIALVKVGRMRDRIQALERGLRELRSEQRGDAAAIVAPAPKPEPVVLPHRELADEITPRPPVPVPVAGSSEAWDGDGPALDEPLADEKPSRAPEALKAPKIAIDWERWVGVRGAAILGGIALALAGLFFFQHALTQGWIGPGARVLTGAIVGTLCLLSKVPLQRRGYALLGSVLAGAGAVILYGAAWAGARKYELFPIGAGFAWMLAVTAACVWLAWRHRSQLIAIFGLVGGFATPLLLSTGQDRPITLFGYILLLDLAMLALARKRSWPLLGLLGVVGTTLVQALWIFMRMDPERAGLGLVILGVFALVFVLSGHGSKESRTSWLASQVAGVLLPFAMAFYFAGRSELGEHLWPVAGLCALLGAASYWVSAEGHRQLVVTTVLATIGIVGAWLVSRQGPEAAEAWEFVWAACVLTVVHIVCGEWSSRGLAAPEKGRHTWLSVPGAGAGILALGLSLLYGFITAERGNDFVPFLPSAVLALALAVLGLFATRRRELAAFPLITGFAAGVVLLGFHNSHALATNPGYPGNLAIRLTLLALGFLFLVVGRARLSQPSGSWTLLGALACLLPATLGLVPPRDFEPHLYLGTTLAFAAVAVHAAIWARSQWGYAATVFAIGIAAVSWRGNYPWVVVLPSAPETLGWHAAIAGLLALAPAAMRAGLSTTPNIWRVAAVAPLLWFSPSLFGLFREWQEEWLVLLPLGLGTICAAGFALESRYQKQHGLEKQSTGYVWYGASAAFFAGFAPAILIDVHWLPLGGVVVGLAWSVLASHTQRPKLRNLASMTLMVGAIALIGLMLMPRAFERTDALLFNEVTYVYLLPTAVLLLASRFHRPLGDSDHRIANFCRGTSALFAALLLFVWLNLEVLNAFTTTDHLHVRIEPDAGRNLAHSVAWTVYSLGLLAVGTVRRASAPRWMSLVFLLATIAKVFLYDLRELQGLYRAGSMLGLAVCLLIVSALYQRFVFRKPEAD